MPLPDPVTTALAALVPHDALAAALRPRSRAPGSLSWRHELLDGDVAAHLLGRPLPVLPTLRGQGFEEFTSVHRGAPDEPLRSQLEEGSLSLHLRIAYLEAGRSWVDAAVWPLVVHGGSLLEVRARDRTRDRPWPQRVTGLHDAGTGDYAAVVVDGTEVGVQADLSGVVMLTWVDRRGPEPVDLSLLTRRGPRAAVELLVGDGLLGPA
ncbi:hypothetical protein ACFQ46_03315 [Kineococcus sp. GCM10028916]|uniref:hypothetical protein n=1 Tax=Kineococcus sp. GCM10028916 TaxID=3273394 RepID=UPI0036307141